MASSTSVAGTDNNFNPSTVHQRADTPPLFIKTAPIHAGKKDELDGLRTAVAEDLGSSISEVSYEFFEKNILPPLHSSIRIGPAIQKLRKAGLIVDGRWKYFPEDPHYYAKSSLDITSTENAVFGNLVPLINGIIDGSSSGRGLTQLVEYASLPNNTPVCSLDEKRGKPDGYFLFKDRTCHDGGRHYWRDIATPAEYKLRDTRKDLQNDIDKICCNMHQVMQEDPRRRFVLAITIENNMMRIWMANRSEMLVSKPFNFITDHTKFVHFVLSLAFAEEHQLGIDTTVKLVKTTELEKPPMYDYIVGSRLYRTNELINDDGAKSLRGRGTRIWGTNEVINGKVDSKRSGVLKDYWMDHDRMREVDILTAIKDQEGISEDTRKILSELFLTPIASWEVHVNGRRDGTRSLMTSSEEIPAEAVPFYLRVPTSHRPSHTIPAHSETDDSPPVLPEKKVVQYHPKYHDRTVFMERCKPLSDSISLGEIFTALLYIICGLSVMHEEGEGWVHRDLSPGNILLPGDGQKVKLSDLEYAKRLNDDGAHSIRTGTANFMAIEVDGGQYYFNFKANDLPVNTNAQPASVKAIWNGALDAPSSPVNIETNFERPAPFRYNPTHDYESIFWVAVYFVVNMETARANEGTAGWVPLTQEQLSYARSLFYSRLPRFQAISTQATPLDAHMHSLPNHLSNICALLISLRKDLLRHYHIIEEPGYVITKTVCRSLVNKFVTTFRSIVWILQREDIVIAPLGQNPLQS